MSDPVLTRGDVQYSAEVSVSYEDHGGTAEIDVMESVGGSTFEVDQTSLEVVSAEDAYIYSEDNNGLNTALYVDFAVNSDLPLDDTYVYTQSTNNDQSYVSSQLLDNSQSYVSSQSLDNNQAYLSSQPLDISQAYVSSQSLDISQSHVSSQSLDISQSHVSSQPLEICQPGILPQEHEYSHAGGATSHSAHATEQHQPMHSNQSSHAGGATSHSVHATDPHQPMHSNQYSHAGGTTSNSAHATEPHQPMLSIQYSHAGATSNSAHATETMHSNQSFHAGGATSNSAHATETHQPMLSIQYSHAEGATLNSAHATEPHQPMHSNQSMHSAQTPIHPGSNPTSMHAGHLQTRPQPANNSRINGRPQAQVNAPPRPQSQVSNQGRVNSRPQQTTRPRPRPNPQNPAYSQNGMNPGATADQDPQTHQNAGSPDSGASTIHGQPQEYSDAHMYSTPTEYSEYSAVGVAEQNDNGSGQFDVDYSQLASNANEVEDIYDDGSNRASDGDSLSTALGGIDSLSVDGGGEAVDLLSGLGAVSAAADLFTGDPTAAIGAAATSAISAFSGAAVQNAASTVVNAFSSVDTAAAVQAGVEVAMSGVRIAASIGNWNEIRQKRKASQAQFAAAHGASNPVVMSRVAIAAQLDEALLVLSVLGQRLVVLEAINLAELPQAHAACRTACGQADSGDLLEHFDTLDGTLQYAVTAALFFCAACWPMHIYRGFGTGVLGNFHWGCPHPQYNIGQTAGFNSVDRLIAFLKSMPREVQLLTRLPHGLNRFTPSYDKNDKLERKKLMSAYRQFVREIEAKGHPQPRDGSFRIVSWHIPFATWNSPFTFKNSGHYWEDFLRWQMDPGRLLHAWTIGGHLDLNYGEMMWLPPGVSECLARWLVGLSGTTFKLVPSSALDYSLLKLTPETRRIMLEDGFETVKAVRDPQAESRKPVIAQNIFIPAPPPVVRKPSVASPAQPGRPTRITQAHGNQQIPAQTIARRPMNQHPAPSQPGALNHAALHSGGISSQPIASHHAVSHAAPHRMPSITGGHPEVASHQHNAITVGNAPTAAAPGYGHSTTRGVPMGNFSMATISSSSKISEHPAHKMTPEIQNRIPVRKPTNGPHHATTGGPAATVPPHVLPNPLAQVHSSPPSISRTSTISSHHSSSSYSSTAPSQQTFTTSTSNTTPTSSPSFSHPAGISASIPSHAGPQAQYPFPPSNSQPPAPTPAPAAVVKRRPVPRRPPPVQPVLRKVKAVENFEPEDDHELGFVVGDLLDILKEMDDGWWEARLRGKIGAIPPDFVEVVEE